jgi:hypothetical protein
MSKIRRPVPGEKQPVGIGNRFIQLLPQTNDEFMLERKADSRFPPPEQGVDNDNQYVDTKNRNQRGANTNGRKKGRNKVCKFSLNQ